MHWGWRSTHSGPNTSVFVSNQCICSVRWPRVKRGRKHAALRSDLGLRQRKQIDCRPAKIKEESPSVRRLLGFCADGRALSACVCARCLSQTALGHATHVRPRAEKSAERDKARDAQIAACRQWLTWTHSRTLTTQNKTECDTHQGVCALWTNGCVAGLSWKAQLMHKARRDYAKLPRIYKGEKRVSLRN